MSFCFITFSLFLFAGLAIQNGSISFFLLSISASFFTIWTFLFLRKKDKLFNISYILLLSHFAGILSFLFYLSTAESDIIFNNEYQLFVYDHVPAISLSIFIPVLSILVGSHLIARKKGMTAFEFAMSNYYPSPIMIGFSLFLCINTLVFNLFFLTGRTLPIIGYVTTVIHASFIMFSFWVGYWNTRLRWVFPIVLFAIFVDSGISVLAGGRFILFIHFALLYIGYVVSMPTNKQKVLIAAAVILLPFIFSLVAIMGVVRDRIGRGDEALLQEGRVAIYLSAFGDVFSGNSGLSDDELNDLGVGRTINWPNLSVMALSPTVIPYSGFSNIQNEIEALFTVSGISSGTSRESINESRNEQIEKGLGTGMANKYGYMVNENNSVEWGLLADAWSKGGPVFFFLFYSILFLLFILYENRISGLDHFSRLIFTLILVRIVVAVSTSLPFYFTLRALLLDTIMAFIVVSTFRLFYRYVKI